MNRNHRLMILPMLALVAGMSSLSGCYTEPQQKSGGSVPPDVAAEYQRRMQQSQGQAGGTMAPAGAPAGMPGAPGGGAPIGPPR